MNKKVNDSIKERAGYVAVNLPTFPLRSFLVWAELIVTYIWTGLISLLSAGEERQLS